MKASSLTDYVFLCMRDGSWWTFWELQSVIKEKTNKFYGEPSISAAIRNIRKSQYRSRYKIPMSVDDPIESKRKEGTKANLYRLNINGGMNE